MTSLEHQASEFANSLSEVSIPALGPEARFESAQDRDRGVAWVGPGSFDPDNSFGFGLIQLRAPDKTGKANLAIRCSFQVQLTDRGDLTVDKSWMALLVHKTSWRPILRIEVDPTQDRRHHAHVHFHGESTELGWVLGRAGRPYKDVHDLHFPLGGRHFRPTLEDLLLFIDREKLFTGWHEPEWKARAEKSIDRFRVGQTEVTIRRHLGALRQRGWVIKPPA